MFARIVALSILPLLVSCFGGNHAPPPANKIQKFEIDSSHSSIIFEIRHLHTSYIHGRFDDFSGDLVINHGNSADCRIELTIATASINTNNSDRDQHLLGPAFFDAEAHPTIDFRSTRFISTKSLDFRVEGEMTMNGQTHPLAANVRFTGSIAEHKDFGTRIGYQAEFMIQRSMFGMTEMLGPIGDEISVTVNIEAILQ